MEPTACFRHNIGDVVLGLPRQVGHDMASEYLCAGHAFNDVTIDSNTRDVQLLSSKVNHMLFGFVCVLADVVICRPLLNLIHILVELVLAMRVAHFVQSDVIDEQLHAVYDCVQVVNRV